MDTPLYTKSLEFQELLKISKIMKTNEKGWPVKKQ
jgi:hypothetical protein